MFGIPGTIYKHVVEVVLINMTDYPREFWHCFSKMSNICRN